MGSGEGSERGFFGCGPASPILIRAQYLVAPVSRSDLFRWPTTAGITESTLRSGIEPLVCIVGSLTSVEHTVELQDLPSEHSQPPNPLRQRCENQFPACAKNCEHPGNRAIQRKQALPRRTSRLPSNCEIAPRGRIVMPFSRVHFPIPWIRAPDTAVV